MTSKQKNIASILLAFLMVAGAIVFIVKGKSVNTYFQNENENNVSIVDGIQIVEIKAKGGYWPRKSVAKAGIPTVIRFNTKGTFDCSSAVTIPNLSINKLLPQSGVTDIEIGEGKLGTLKGTCGMGMYPFEIDFQS